MTSKKLRPGGFLVAFRSGLDPVVNKDSLDGVVRDDVAKVSERTLDTSLAPARIAFAIWTTSSSIFLRTPGLPPPAALGHSTFDASEG
ncbi:MAG: hypothetical protein V3W41_20500 [Planctomycetota bacterium]